MKQITLLKNNAGTSIFPGTSPVGQNWRINHNWPLPLYATTAALMFLTTLVSVATIPILSLSWVESLYSIAAGAAGVAIGSAIGLTAYLSLCCLSACFPSKNIEKPQLPLALRCFLCLCCRVYFPQYPDIGKEIKGENSNPQEYSTIETEDSSPNIANKRKGGISGFEKYSIITQHTFLTLTTLIQLTFLPIMLGFTAFCATAFALEGPKLLSDLSAAASTGEIVEILGLISFCLILSVCLLILSSIGAKCFQLSCDNHSVLFQGKALEIDSGWTELSDKDDENTLLIQ